jgi:regulator of nucleoside diphosphate kinase
MVKKRIILSKQDFDRLTNLAEDTDRPDPIDRKCRLKLAEELKTALVLDRPEMPLNVVQINSVINITTPFGSRVGIQLVMPGEADMQRGKLSVMSPMGTALIGYKEGDKVCWHFPKGDETITIKSVMNTPLEK